MNQSSQHQNEIEKSQVDVLKDHVRAIQRSKIDAKYILLMDNDGKVEEPTKQTISLLGARSQAAYRKSQSTVLRGAALDSDTLATSIEA